MKRAVILATLVLFTFSVTAVEGYDSPEYQPHIMGSTSGASQAVGPNGTEWKAEASMVNRTNNLSENQLENINYGEDNYSVEFDGFIRASTPCHVISHDVEETEAGYVMQINTEKDELDVGGNQSPSLCAQVMTTIKYEGSFSTNESFTLEVRHDNQTVDTLEYPENSQSEKAGPISSFFNWLSGLF